MRTSRYLYTEWDGDKNPSNPERELYDTYADPYQLTNLAGDPGYASVVDELGDELDQLIDCAGDSCRGAPSGSLTFTHRRDRQERLRAGAGDRALQQPAGERHRRRLVPGRQGRRSAMTPRRRSRPRSPSRRCATSCPDAATVTAKALFDDGRRLGQAANLKACR